MKSAWARLLRRSTLRASDLTQFRRDARWCRGPEGKTITAPAGWIMPAGAVVRRAADCSGWKYALRLGRVRRDRIHQRRVEAIVRLELQLFQTRAHRAHLVGLGTRLNDG